MLGVEVFTEDWSCLGGEPRHSNWMWSSINRLIGTQNGEKLVLGVKVLAKGWYLSWTLKDEIS